MKKALLLTLSMFLLTFATLAQQETPQTTDAVLQQAYVQAAKEKKNVMVIFHASWCGWCKKLDASINDANCKQLFDKNYVITHLVVYESKGKENLENPGALALLSKYHGNNAGVPYFFVFDPKGNLLADSKMRPNGGAAGSAAPGDNVGCPSEDKEVDFFADVLKETSSLKANELEVIKNRFRQNKPQPQVKAQASTGR